MYIWAYPLFSANSHGNPIFVVTLENIQQQFLKMLGVSLSLTYTGVLFLSAPISHRFFPELTTYVRITFFEGEVFSA